MSRSGTRLLPSLAAAWLVVTGAFLFVKGLDISLVACDERTCGDIADLIPGIASFVVGVGMLLAWPYVVSSSEEGTWPRRLGIGLISGALAAALLAIPVLAVTERLGIPFWACVALVSAIAIRPPPAARDEAIRGRVVVASLLFAIVVGAELLLEGDAYVLAFTMCIALTPPAFAGVDDFALGWQARALESEQAEPEPDEPEPDEPEPDEPEQELELQSVTDR